MAKIYYKDWRKGSTDDFNWDNCYEIPFEKFSIDEGNYENRTATFTSDTNLELEDKNVAIKITGDFPTFSGLVLSKQKKPGSLYEYKCQDWNRIYMSKPYMNEKKSVHLLIKQLLNFADDSTTNVHAGLLDPSKYEQKKYGSIISFNPMKTTKQIKGSDKTVKEWIEYLIYSQHPFIRIHYNNTGRMLFTPYHFNDYVKEVASFHYTDLTDWDWNFNQTNVVTGAYVNGKYMNVAKMFGSHDPYTFLAKLVSTKQAEKNNETTSKTKTSKKTNPKSNNPYNTKKKEVWVSMDNWQGGSIDRKYYDTVCSTIKKQGWKVHKIGIGPQTHDENHIASSGAKNGVWLTVYGGVDVGCIRETCFDTSYKNILLRRNLLPVIAFNSTADIRRGGNRFSGLAKAWDDNYSSGDTSMKYPGGCMATCGVPWLQVPGNHPKKLGLLFCAGGDSKIALTKKYKKNGHGYYANFNWSSKY